MTAAIALTFAAAGLLVALVVYKRVVERRRRARLSTVEFVAGSAAVGGLAMAAGVLAVFEGHTASDTIAGVLLLCGGLIFVGGGTYAAWLMRD